MAYSVPKRSEKFYRDKDMQYLQMKYRGKLPPVSVLSKEGQMMVYRQHKAMRTGGTVVLYKGKLAMVDSSNSKGVFLRRIGEDYLDEKDKKPFFVDNQTYHDNSTYYSTVTLI